MAARLKGTEMPDKYDRLPTVRDVRRIYPPAPELGASVRIYCGVTRQGQYAVVGGPNDVARKATVLGYEIRIGENGFARDPGVLVRVRLAVRHPMIGRILLAHVGCLTK